MCVDGVLCCCCGPWLRCCGRLTVKCEQSCWYVTDKHVCVASYLTCSILLLIADWSSLLVFFFCFWHTSTFQTLDIQNVVTGVVRLFSPRLLPSFFWRVGFSTHWSSNSKRVLLTHALALSASQLVHKTKIYTSTHSGGFELMKLTCNTRFADITWYATGAVGDIEPVAPVVQWGYTRIRLLLVLALVLELNNYRCELC